MRRVHNNGERIQLSVSDAKSKVECPKVDTSLEQILQYDSGMSEGVS